MENSAERTPTCGRPGTTIGVAACAEGLLQPLAHAAGEEIGRRMAVAELQDRQPAVPELIGRELAIGADFRRRARRRAAYRSPPPSAASAVAARGALGVGRCIAARNSRVAPLGGRDRGDGEVALDIRRGDIIGRLEPEGVGRRAR